MLSLFGFANDILMRDFVNRASSSSSSTENVIDKLVWKYCKETFHPNSDQAVQFLKKQEKEIYNFMVRTLLQTYNSLQSKTCPSIRYVAFCRAKSWESIKTSLRKIIRTTEEAIREKQGGVDPTLIQTWAINKIKFIDQLIEYDAMARSLVNVRQQVSSTTLEEVENGYLTSIKNILKKEKAQFDQDAKNPALMNNTSCAALINKVRCSWKNLSVFSDPDWRHVNMDSKGIWSLIIDGSKNDLHATLNKANNTAEAIFLIKNSKNATQAEGLIPHIAFKYVIYVEEVGITIKATWYSD